MVNVTILFFRPNTGLSQVVAEDGGEAGRMIPEVSQTVVQGYFHIRQKLASRLDHAGRLVHTRNYQVLLGEQE